MIDKPFDVKLNMDTATEYEIQKTNEALIDYLEENGDYNAAEHIAYLVKQSKKTEPKKEKSNSINDKLLKVNENILSTLRKRSNSKSSTLLMSL